MYQEITSARRIGNLLHPFASKEKFVTVLAAYLDDSGTSPDSPVVVVAGWLATTDRWEEFERKWVPLLKECGLDRWKHSHFYGRHGEYHKWDDAKWLYAHNKVSEILGSLNLMGVGAAVKREDYEEIRRTREINLSADPYSFCVERCMNRLLHGVRETNRDEGIAIFCDQNPAQKRIGEAVFDWHKRHVADLKPVFRDDSPERQVSVTYGSDRMYIPLQAADIIAHEAQRYVKAGGALPFLGGRLPEGRDPHSSDLMDSLFGKSSPAVQCYSMRDLEMAHTYDAGFGKIAKSVSLKRKPSSEEQSS